MERIRTFLALAVLYLFVLPYWFVLVSPVLLIRQLFKPRQRWNVPALAFVLAAFCVSPALAQIATTAQAEAAPANQLFHIPAAAWSEINTLLIGLVVALVSLAVKWLDNRSPLKGTQAEAVARDAFTALLTNGAKYGLTQLQAQEKRVGDIDVGNPAVAAGANFVIAQGPKLAAQMGFDVTTPEGRAAIIRSVTLRVGDLMTPAGSPPQSVPLPSSVALAGTPSSPDAPATPPNQNSGAQPASQGKAG